MVVVKTCFILLLLSLGLVFTQNNSIDRICKNCGDIVNRYCCRYQKRCCEYLNPTGCPTPASPEARISCRTPQFCRSNEDCPMFKQCCDTSICGATCMKPTFSGYRY